MAQRTTQSKVAAVLKSQYDENQWEQQFINQAYALVDWLASKDTAGALTTDLLEHIESNLAAHFYMISLQMKQSKATGKSNASFRGQTGMMLDYTPYGQSAKLMDITGRLGSEQRNVGITWLGTDVQDQDNEPNMEGFNY